MVLMAVLSFLFAGCETGSEVDRAETQAVNRQQEHYAVGQPVPFFEHSLQRDVYTQIYQATNEARNTFTIVESTTGVTKWACPSVGYGIPADVSLTNPLKGSLVYGSAGTYRGTHVTEQAEPNGLFSSKNTDGTWILCVLATGEIAPIYTEHKISTFPFFVDGVETEWSQQAGTQASTNVQLPGR